MTALERIAAAVLVAAIAGPVPTRALAQDPARAVELAAHAALAEVMARPGAALAPFTTDGCSGGMSGLWALLAAAAPRFAAAHGDRPPWEDCCVTHDRAYHAGGADPAPAAGYAARAEADAALGACVRARAADDGAGLQAAFGLSPAQIGQFYVTAAEAMTAMVRLGGGPCSGLPWRWGYGWPQCGPFAE